MTKMRHFKKTILYKSELDSLHSEEENAVDENESGISESEEAEKSCGPLELCNRSGDTDANKWGGFGSDEEEAEDRKNADMDIDEVLAEAGITDFSQYDTNEAIKASGLPSKIKSALRKHLNRSKRGNKAGKAQSKRRKQMADAAGRE